MIKSLEFKNLSLTVGDQIRLFQNVSLALPLNQVVWVRGASGSGKSTLLKIIAGLVSPQGEYLVNGENVLKNSFEEFLPLRKRIGYSFDFGGLLSNRTLIENLTLPLMYHENLAPQEAESQIQDLLSDFQIMAFKSLRPSGVVGGVRKSVCVARAFVMSPEMLLLDDPTTGLRSEVKVALQKRIQKMKSDSKSKSIFIVTEDKNFILDVFDSVLTIENSNLTLSSSEQWRAQHAS